MVIELAEKDDDLPVGLKKAQIILREAIGQAWGLENSERRDLMSENRQNVQNILL
jgi:hypothetical protein